MTLRAEGDPTPSTGGDWLPAEGVPFEAIQTFFAAHWPRPVVVTDPRFYQWQFGTGPDGPREDASQVLVDGDRVLGFAGITPQAFHWADGSPKPGATMTAFVLSPEAQGGSAAWALLDQLQETYDVLLSTNPSPAAKPLYQRMGYRVFGQMERVVRVWRLDALRSDSRLSGPRLPRVVPGPAPDVIEIDDADTLARWVDQGAPPIHHFRRSAADLAWRYLKHPAFAYRLRVLTQAGCAPLLLVWRVEDLADRPGVRVAHVVECLPLEDGPLANPLPVLEDAARADALDLMDAYLTWTPAMAPFWRGGWVSTWQDPDIRIPHRLHPPSLTDPPTASVALWARDGLEPLCDWSRLYLTKGDGDLDRPARPGFLTPRHEPKSACVSTVTPCED